jgi:5-methylcytosine-specific restriction enzyme A
MTARAVPEWIGKTPDTPIPKRVKDRIVENQEHLCAEFKTRFTAIDKPIFDHIIPLADGGENRETNLQALSMAAHAVKTKAEASERASVRRKRAKHLGLEAPSKNPLQSRDAPPMAKADRLRAKHTGTYPKSRTPLRSRGFASTRPNP